MNTYYFKTTIMQEELELRKCKEYIVRNLFHRLPQKLVVNILNAESVIDISELLKERLNLDHFQKYEEYYMETLLKAAKLGNENKISSKNYDLSCNETDDVILNHMILHSQKLELREQAKRTNLQKYKLNILLTLPDKIQKYIKDFIIKAKTIDAINLFLDNNLSTAFKQQLSVNGFEFFHDRLKPNSAKIAKGIYFDRTVNSIKPIYTPMGNKR